MNFAEKRFKIATCPAASKPSSASAELPTIGVVVNNVGGYSRSVFRGITSYANARAWTCILQGVNGPPVLTHAEDFDGIIVQTATPEQAKTLAATRTPVVNVSSALPLERFLSVVSDDAAVGRLGADYFLRRGYRCFVFFAPDARRFVKLRQDGFSGRLRVAGQSAIVAADVKTLERHLRTPGPPLAVMGCNDGAALSALEACRRLGRRVPDDVAVLGVDNDDLVQSLAPVPLSTVNTARQRIGFEAAAMLETLMNGRAPAASPVLVPPTGVITRQSTDLLAIADENVAAAVRFIQAHAGRPIGVGHVLAEVPLSRRQLERRFREALGRSILDEISRCRIDRARQLLVDTELALPQVATASGFASASYFNVVFRAALDTTPGEYRRRFQIE